MKDLKHYQSWKKNLFRELDYEGNEGIIAIINGLENLCINLKDKIKRRNTQIKRLKEKLKALQSGNYSTNFETQQ